MGLNYRLFPNGSCTKRDVPITVKVSPGCFSGHLSIYCAFSGGRLKGLLPTEVVGSRGKDCKGILVVAKDPKVTNTTFLSTYTTCAINTNLMRVCATDRGHLTLRRLLPRTVVSYCSSCSSGRLSHLLS